MRCSRCISLILFIINAAVASDFQLRPMQTDASHFPRMTTRLLVYDEKREAMGSLTASQFTVAVDAKPATAVSVTTAEKSGVGYHILLCVDVSGSMTGSPLATLKKSATAFITSLRNEDDLAIIGLADKVTLISDFSSDQDYLREKISSLTTTGTHSLLYCGLNDGLKRLSERTDKPGRALILISDGKNEDPASSYTENDVIELAQKQGIPIFAIGFSKIDPSYLRSLERMAEKTGGNYYATAAESELEAQQQKLYDQLKKVYILDYLAADTPTDGLAHTAVLTVDLGGIRRTVQTAFTAPYIAPPRVTRPWWPYALSGGVLLLLAAGSLFWIVKNRKNRRREEERARAAAEEEHQRELADERNRREDLERKIISAHLEAEKRSRPSAEERPQAETRPNRDKTMILSNSASPARAYDGLRVEIMVGELQGARIDINRAGATIGRAKDNTIVLPENTVSGHHARISYGRGFQIEDLDSSNGTFVNGQRITRSMIADGDTVKIGRVEGIFRLF